MTTVLNRNWKSRMAARFGGRLRTATIVRKIVSGPDPADSAGPPLSTPQTYTCDAVAFAYQDRYVDGEVIRISDYQVTILLGTILAVADDAVAASADLGATAGTGALDTVVRALEAGAAGNEITVELAPAIAAALVEVGRNVRIDYVDGVTTVADVETLLALSGLVAVATPGTGATVLVTADAFAATPLAGGSDSTTSSAEFVPAAGDEITIPPPGSTTPVAGTVFGKPALTEAFATCGVRGPGA